MRVCKACLHARPQRNLQNHPDLIYILMTISVSKESESVLLRELIVESTRKVDRKVGPSIRATVQYHNERFAVLYIAFYY